MCCMCGIFMVCCPIYAASVFGIFVVCTECRQTVGCVCVECAQYKGSLCVGCVWKVYE